MEPPPPPPPHPRLALYEDICDPSRKGAARLAINLKEHILKTIGSEPIEDEAPSAHHLTGDLHYRLLRRHWDVSREPLSGSSARVDRRHRRADIKNKLPSISSTAHFPMLLSRAERPPGFDAKPSAPPVTLGHSACPQQFPDKGDHLLTTPDTRQASVSNTHAQTPISAPVSQYPSPTYLPHMSQMNTIVPSSNVSSQYVQLLTTNPCNCPAPYHQHLLQNQPATAYPYNTWWTGHAPGSDSSSVS